MTKEVLLTIKGLQFNNETGNDSIEVITKGDYYLKNGKRYIIFDEVSEGFEGSTHNIIKINGNCMDVTKKGIANVHMVFEENKKNMAYYNTPFGNILVGILTRNVAVDETEDNIDVNVDYELEVNYEHLAECSIAMNIKPKDTKNFSLR